MKGELLWMHYRQENIRKQKKRYMKKIFLLGILGHSCKYPWLIFVV